MLFISKKSIKKLISGLTPDISSFENIKISKIHRKRDKYELI
jgi:hypothetical protein